MSINQRTLVNANDLYYTNLMREERLKEEYENILEICCKTIVQAFGKKKKSIIFEVPLTRKIEDYNVLLCSTYLLLELRKRGFYVRFLMPNKIWIEIRDIENEEKYKKQILFLLYEDRKTNKILDDHGDLFTKNKINHTKNENELLDYHTFDHVNSHQLLIDYQNDQTIINDQLKKIKLQTTNEDYKLN